MVNYTPPASDIIELKNEIKKLKEQLERWKKLFNKIDSVYSKGIYLNVKNEFMLLTSNARELNELFNKWEEEELKINGDI